MNPSRALVSLSLIGSVVAAACSQTPPPTQSTAPKMASTAAIAAPTTAPGAAPASAAAPATAPADQKAAPAAGGREIIALAVSDMVKPLGIRATPVGRSWDDIQKAMHSNAVLFGWGSHDATEIYNIYHGSLAGNGFFNPGFYQSQATDAKLDRAMGAPTDEEAAILFKAVQWDGSQGVTAKGDAVWAWLVNLNHTYFVSNCLDVGTPQIEPHGHGWPITANIADWQWTCG